MNVITTRTEARGELGASRLALKPLSRALGAEIDTADLTWPPDGPIFERIRNALDESDGLLVLHNEQDRIRCARAWRIRSVELSRWIQRASAGAWELNGLAGTA